MHELKRLSATRIVSTPAALDAVDWPDGYRILRFAQDEILIVPALEEGESDLMLQHDPHAIVIQDNSFAGMWMPIARALDVLERTCEWEIPAERPTFAQGAVAGIPAKLWLEEDRVLFVVQAPYAAEFEERTA